MLVNSVSSGLAFILVTAITATGCTSSQRCATRRRGGRFTVVRVKSSSLSFMLINKQALMGFGLNKQENAVHGRRIPPPAAIARAEVRARQRHRKDQHDNRLAKQGDKILLNAEQIHILVANLRPPSSRETDQTAGDDHNNGLEEVSASRSARRRYFIKAEIKLTSRITTDRLKIREL